MTLRDRLLTAIYNPKLFSGDQKEQFLSVRLAIHQRRKRRDGIIIHIQIQLISLDHVVIRTFATALAVSVRVDVDALNDVDADRSNRGFGQSPRWAGCIGAGSGRPGFVVVQAQQNQDEGDANHRARSVQKGILDVGTPKECAESGCYEDAVDKVNAAADRVIVEITHVSSAADSAKTLSARKT